MMFLARVIKVLEARFAVGIVAKLNKLKHECRRALVRKGQAPDRVPDDTLNVVILLPISISVNIYASGFDITLAVS